MHWLRAGLGLLPVVALAVEPLPREFTVREQTTAGLERRFDLYSRNDRLATGILRPDEDTHILEIRDRKGGAFAVARFRPFSWGTGVTVSDPQGKRLGVLKERLYPGTLRSKAKWEAYDGAGDLLAISTEKDVMTTELVLVDKKSKEEVKLEKPPVSLGNYWKVQLTDKFSWDPRFVLSLSVFRVASDATRSK